LAEGPDILGAANTGWLRIEREAGRILDCSATAAQWLGADSDSLAGTPWREVFADSACAGQLALALAGSSRAPLAPFVRDRRGESGIVLAGMVLPGEGGLVLLWPLLDADNLGLPADFGPGDVVAALGVERVSPAGRSPAEVMGDVRDSLSGILRRRDYLSQAIDNTVVLVLKDLDLDAALDMSRAILSHLNGTPALAQESVPGVRLGVGLALVEAGTAPIRTLLAANNALLCLRYREDAGRIRVAAAGDAEYLAELAANPYALFSDAPALQFEQLSRAAGGARPDGPLPPGRPLETGIEGYVADNMEGAVDQAIFLAGLDTPIAIIGPAGTGKLYIARIIQQQSKTGSDALVVLDCREFRSRADANQRIAAALSTSGGRTLVFKSPHLMHQEAQVKLARQISTRRLADVSPPQYLPGNQLVALFPDDLERLVARGELAPQLASVFAGYPIHVPPIRDRKQAVLRWAHKILAQEGELRQRELKGFTPDAEKAMLLHDWPGNITEMRQCIVDALERSDKAWITPVDLGLYRGISAEGSSREPESLPFLQALERPGAGDTEEAYAPSTLESLDLSLGQAVNSLVAAGDYRPVGTWAEDDMVLAALDRYRGNAAKAAALLHTRSRNISRWLPRIEEREDERNSHPQWQEPRRLLREWVRETPVSEESPTAQLEAMLLAHVQRQAGQTSVAERARMLGVSVPTYHKRLKMLTPEQDR
jgi:DNA-binding NtrC family response regulator